MMFRDEALEGDMGEGFFYFCFERAPYFTGLAVAGLETRELAFEEGGRDFDWPVEDFLDFPDSNHAGRSSE